MPSPDRSTRVLHVIRRLDVARGAERIVAELVRRIPGHDVLVFDGGASAYDLGVGKLLRAGGLAHALWMCLRLRRKYDVFHLHLAPSIYLAAVLGKRAIIHEHNTNYEKRKRLVQRTLSDLAMRRAAAVIAVSEAVEVKLSRRLGGSARITALPNFVAELPHAQDTSSGERNLLMVAAFERPKLQDRLIRALPLLPQDIQVTFAGDGPTLLACRELARELGVDHRVTFLGSVHDISRQYARARLCVLLSEWEGFGMVVLEAAQFGKATLVSDIDGLRDSCPDARLLYDGEKADDLAHRILQTLEFCETPTFRARLRSHAITHDFGRYALLLDAVYGALKNLIANDKNGLAE